MEMINGEHRCPAPGCAETAAKNAVKQVFAILGVDVDKPESVEAFREDLRFGRLLRRTADKGLMAAVVVMAIMLTGALGLGVKMKLFP